MPRTSAGSTNVSLDLNDAYEQVLMPFGCADSERTQNLQAIAPERISISPTGHVLLTLDTRKHSGPGGGGKDVVVWGANFEYQLGNGKRGSLPTPTTLLTPEGERFMLQRKRATAVRDLQGQVWKKGVEVEQRALAGWNNSVVYWRICS